MGIPANNIGTLKLSLSPKTKLFFKKMILFEKENLSVSVVFPPSIFLLHLPKAFLTDVEPHPSSSSSSLDPPPPTPPTPPPPTPPPTPLPTPTPGAGIWFGGNDWLLLRGRQILWSTKIFLVD